MYEGRLTRVHFLAPVSRTEVLVGYAEKKKKKKKDLVIYRKIPKYSDTQNIAVIILKFEQCGSTIELRVQKMKTEWQTV